jgi:hypothetical protein
MQHERRHDWLASRWEYAGAEGLRGVWGAVFLQRVRRNLLVRRREAGPEYAEQAPRTVFRLSVSTMPFCCTNQWRE